MASALSDLDHPFIRSLRRSGLFTLAIPRMAMIDDLRWGAVDRLLKLGIIGYLISAAFYADTPVYEQSYPTTGFFTELWFDESAMVDRVTTDNSANFCSSPYSFGYLFATVRPLDTPTSSV